MLRLKTVCLLGIALCFFSAATTSAIPIDAETSQQEPKSTAADHVVLVSIDGLRPEFYLDPTWPAPRLQQLAAKGSFAENVSSVFPSATYPSHTTMVTGAVPARHGVYYNSPFEPEGSTGRWYWEAELIKTPTLWQAAREAGLKSAALGWPVTVGADVDWLIPEIWPLDDSDFIEHTRRLSTPGLMAEIEREATGRLTTENFTIDHLTRDDRAGAAAAYLLETYRPNLLLLHLLGTDHFQHSDGRDSDRVRLAVAAADRALSQVVEAAERAGISKRTTFVIVGDHGHVELHTRLAPNVWLRDAGLADHVEEGRGEWRALFHTTGASAFLQLRDPADLEAVKLARQALAAQPAGVRGLYRIVERAELDALGVDPAVPFALNPQPGVDVTSATEDPAIRPASGATHGYIPDFSHIQTGLVVAGAGVRQGAQVHQLHLTAVAPLVAEILGLEFAALDGVAPLGFLLDEDAPNH